MLALMPTPVPMLMAFMICCIGNASDTAVNAFSEILATNIESTMLYIAWMKNDSIIGIAMLMRSWKIGMVPILFSVFLFSLFSIFHLCFRPGYSSRKFSN